MLFGNKNLQNKVLEDAIKFAEENHFRIVYGAVVGGISRGAQYKDSDYDTRFLYINEDFPNKIYFPRFESENTIIKRFYTDGIIFPYEWIPCWELTSFFQYLKEPYIEGKFSYGLYNVVGWTMQSPYTWDPYGLQQKLIPLINKIFDKKCLIEYHLSQVKLFWEKDQSMILVKNYIYTIYSTVALNWILKNNTFNPIYLRTMVSVMTSGELRKKINDLLSESLYLSNAYLKNNNTKFMHETHYQGYVNKVTLIEKYIKDTIENASIELDEHVVDSCTKNEVINDIYEMVYYSVFEEQEVKNVSDFIKCDYKESELVEAIQKRWKTIWKCSENNLNSRFYLENNELKLTVKNNFEGKVLRLKLVNPSDRKLKINKIEVEDKNVKRIVTLNGKESFELIPGIECYLDAIDIFLEVGELKITIKFGVETEIEKIKNNSTNIIQNIEILGLSNWSPVIACIGAGNNYECVFEEIIEKIYKEFPKQLSILNLANQIQEISCLPGLTNIIAAYDVRDIILENGNLNNKWIENVKIMFDNFSSFSWVIKQVWINTEDLPIRNELQDTIKDFFNKYYGSIDIKIGGESEILLAIKKIVKGE